VVGVLLFYDKFYIKREEPYLDIINKLNYSHPLNTCEILHRILDIRAKYYMNGKIKVGLKINTL